MHGHIFSNAFSTIKLRFHCVNILGYNYTKDKPGEISGNDVTSLRVNPTGKSNESCLNQNLSTISK